MNKKLAQNKLERTVSSYYDYLEERMAPKPAYERSMPKFVKPAQPPSPVVPIQEPTNCEAIIERMKAYWRK